MLRTRTGLPQQIDCATAQTRSALFQPTWSAMLSTPISQTQPGRSSFMRKKLRGILRCATVSTFQTTPIAGRKQKCGLDLSLLLSVSYVWSDDAGYDCAGPPTGVAVCFRLLGWNGVVVWKKTVKHLDWMEVTRTALPNNEVETFRVWGASEKFFLLEVM